MNTNFIGKWLLLADRSEYATGTPPSSATYSFAAGANNYLEVSIQWTDHEGKAFDVDYVTIPDGLKKPYENPEIADEVMSEFVSENQLDSYTYKSGEVIAYASRVIDSNGIMKVTQRFYTPDGKQLDNIQYYEKG